MHLRNKILAAVCVTVLCGAMWGQQTAPVQQPPLTIDRDPIPSPDPDVVLPSTSEAGGAAAAQSPDQIARERGGFTLRRDAFEVRLNASVLDDKGRTVLTLPKDAFHIYEDGTPQTVNFFRQEDLPVSLGILIDSSGSMYDKREAVNQASIKLVQLSNPKDEAFLVDFSFEAFIDQDFTQDVKKLEQGLNYVKSSGGTALYDALLASADYLAKNAKQPKQVLLVVTDGEDNASGSTLEDAIARIQELDGPTIYCMGLLFGKDSDKREARHARRVLESLAEQTGGIAFFPKNLSEVDGIAEQIAKDIREQYTITYHSTKAPSLGGYRQVKVEAKQKGFNRLTVRTRTGYYPKVSGAAAKAAPANP